MDRGAKCLYQQGYFCCKITENRTYTSNKKENVLSHVPRGLEGWRTSTTSSGTHVCSFILDALTSGCTCVAHPRGSRMVMAAPSGHHIPKAQNPPGRARRFLLVLLHIPLVLSYGVPPNQPLGMMGETDPVLLPTTREGPGISRRIWH